MRIFQLSDIHIGEPRQYPNEIDVRSNFKKIVDKIGLFKPDIIVISGDLAYRHGDKKIYKWIREQLLFLDLPVYVTCGNHDDPGLIQEIFHSDKEISSDGKLYFSSMLESELFIFLDTGNGEVGHKQLKWFNDLLKKNKADRVFIFMHHPPMNCDIPHMDVKKHQLQDMKAFQEISRTTEAELFVFAGHYHVQRTLKLDNISLNICPSGFFQLDGEVEHFALEHSIPGFQVIDIDSQKVSVQVHYAFDS